MSGKSPAIGPGAHPPTSNPTSGQNFGGSYPSITVLKDKSVCVGTYTTLSGGGQVCKGTWMKNNK